MPKPRTYVHDGYVTEADLVKVKDAIVRNDLIRPVCELIISEPQIGANVSEQAVHMFALLDGVSMSVEQRVIIKKHLLQMVWTPLIALATAHRRSWDDFLPLTAHTEK